MAKAKDQIRLDSGKGNAIARKISRQVNRHAEKLIALQMYAWQKKDLELAEKITDLLQDLPHMNDILELWTEGDIKGLLELIEAGDE